MNQKVVWFAVVASFLLWPRLSAGQGTGGSPSTGSTPSSSSSSTPSSSSSPSTSTPTAAAPSSGTFSIEAEIFGYKSLQSDSEAIACDIAAFLHPDEAVLARPYGQNKLLTPPDWTEEEERRYAPRPEACKFKDNKRPQTPAKGVIALSSTSTAIANYQLWRLDMTLMQVYLAEAKSLGCPSPEKGNEAPSKDVTAVPGEVISLVQSALQLFSNSESALELTGTIQDQALINGVARELRNMNVPTLVPDLYTSFSFASADYKQSPLLSRLIELVRERNCLQKGFAEPMAAAVNTADLTELRENYIQAWADVLKKQNDPALTTPQKNALDAREAYLRDQIKELNTKLEAAHRATLESNLNAAQTLQASIDAFVASLLGATPPSSPTSTASTPSSAPTASSNPAQGSSNAPAPSASGAPAASATPSTPTPAAPNSSVPPIISALTADGLARAMGVGVNGTGLNDSGWRILALKALESGGAIITTTSIFGSKIHFSGGAVATYALFSVDGSLACSGNVFDYGGYLRPGQFSEKFRRPDIEPSKQLLFLRGGCASPGATLSDKAQ
jgi:hypothetical protein